jgi:hypothetical protein
MDGLDEVDCNIYIPNLNDLKMDGETILVPAHVQKVLDELAKSKRQGVDLNYSDDVVFVPDSLPGETEVPDSLEENK